jgi:hypothetical protein
MVELNGLYLKRSPLIITEIVDGRGLTPSEKTPTF